MTMRNYKWFLFIKSFLGEPFTKELLITIFFQNKIYFVENEISNLLKKKTKIRYVHFSVFRVI